MYSLLLYLYKYTYFYQFHFYFRAPKTGNSGSGDFGEVVYWVIKARHSGSQELTVSDVNLHLDKIADKHAAHEPRKFVIFILSFII